MGNQKVKPLIFAEICDTEFIPEPMEKLLKTIREFSKAVRYKTNFKKRICKTK